MERVLRNFSMKQIPELSGKINIDEFVSKIKKIKFYRWVSKDRKIKLELGYEFQLLNLIKQSYAED